MSDTIVQLEGVNGEWFDLAGPGAGEQGVVLAANDVEDVFDDAPVKTIRDESAFQIGSRYRGKRILARYPIFDVLISDSYDSSWRDNHSAWKKAWSYDTDCKLWVEDEHSRRFLELRLNEKMKFTPASDPNQQQIEIVGMACVAGNPWFREPDAEFTWASTVDTTGGGSQTSSFVIDNPCDVFTWLQWDVQGTAGIRWTIPDNSFGSDEFQRAAADAGRAIVMPPLINGEHLWINTDKLAEDGQVNSSLDTQVYMRMGGVRFMYRVPARTPKTTITFAVTGAPIGAGIRCRVPRNWWSPYGGET